ncbi:MAG: ribosomal protein S18-alanine N-acetyltransferase, partial [Ghiorsea sp.]
MKLPNNIDHAFTYREGNIDDIEAVFRLNRLVFDEYWSKDVMLQSLQVGYDLYVCYGDDGLLAYVLSQDILYETQIMQLAVLPTYRRMGIAQHLMHLLMEDKREMDALMLEVRLSNVQAQHFYRHLGFKQAGQRPNYYSKTKTMPREDALLL